MARDKTTTEELKDLIEEMEDVYWRLKALVCSPDITEEQRERIEDVTADLRTWIIRSWWVIDWIPFIEMKPSVPEDDSLREPKEQGNDRDDISSDGGFDK